MEQIRLAKFGKLEHLEALKAGKLYLSPIKILRNDGTLFRGDENEGKVPIDPAKFYINGMSLMNDYGIPKPSNIMLSYNNDDNRFIFCAAMINEETLVPSHDPNVYVLSAEFKKSICQFGDYVIVFWSSDLINRLYEDAQKTDMKFISVYNRISYLDFDDFSNNYYIETQKKNNNFYARYFIKDIRYKVQNEWRLLIDGLDNHLEANCGEGFSIDIGDFDNAQIFDTSTFLDTLRWNE